uniref:Metallophos domain-containing protein n=2 Tax=Mesocestoides corti TaxID=53468 RepID=A0A5K3FBP9_MESCO
MAFVIYMVLHMLIWKLSSGTPAGSYKVGHFWQLTDVHLDLDYERHGCSGDFGDCDCDSPRQLLVSALQATRKIAVAEPDFVVFSGDSTAHAIESETDFERAMKVVATSLKETFPSHRNIPVIPSLGNHDVFPESSMSVNEVDENRRRWCTRLGSDPELWADWVTGPKDADASRFSDGCFFSRLLRINSTANGTQKHLLVISLNGLLYSRRNSQADPNVTDPLGQFQWLLSKLQSARDEKQKAIIIMHFPLGAPENSPVQFRHMYDVYNERLIGILTDFADVISFGLFGHQHVDSFRVVFSKTGDPLLPLFYSPSVSPMYLNALGSFNPRIRFYNYTFGSATPRILDYQQFYVNISADQPSWRLEYAARQAYGLADLSPQSLAGLLARLGDDAAIWCSYWNHELGGQPHDSGPCPELHSKRHCRHLCTMRHLSYSVLDSCLELCSSKPHVVMITSARKTDSDSWNALPIVALVIITFLAILVGVVLLANRELCRKKRRRLAVSSGSTYLDHHLVTYHRRSVDIDLEKQDASLQNVSFDQQQLSAEAEGEAEEEEEEEAYDADESEEEAEVLEDLPASSTPSSRFSRFSLRIGGVGTGGLFGRSSALDGTSTADDDYYSVHSSLQRLCHSGGGGGSRGDVTADQAATTVNDAHQVV